MTIFEMQGQSTVLTVLGMAVVFAFLWIMTVCITMTGKIIIAMESKKNAALPTENGDVTPEITAAIAAAVVEYQKEVKDI